MPFCVIDEEEAEYAAHVYFSTFAESLVTNTHLRKLLTTIDRMVMNAENITTSSKFIMDPNENSLPPAATLGYELVKERLSLDDAQDNSEKGVGIRPG